MSGTIGKARRLSRLIRPADGHSLSLAFDHGLQLGRVAGMADPAAMISAAVEADFDGIILTPGLVERYGHLMRGREAPVIIMRVDQTTMWRVGSPLGYSSGHTRRVLSLEAAIALGADAVITYLFAAHKEPELENRSLEIAAEVAEACRRYGIVHVIEPMAARGGLAADPAEPEAIALPVRIAAELGADVIKADWSGDAKSFAGIVETALAPVVVAGGPRSGADGDTLKFASEVIASGAAGVLFGRHIFQAKNPKGLMKALNRVIHGGEAPARAKTALAS
jgi:DhnA family fructose-bisphosphate aldolase class Ia